MARRTGKRAAGNYGYCPYCKAAFYANVLKLHITGCGRKKYSNLITTSVQTSKQSRVSLPMACQPPITGSIPEPISTGDALTTLAEVKAKLGLLCDERGRVPDELAESLIAGSAIWVSHPSGPCHAPGHAKRVTGSDRGFAIRFGANTFNITVAVQRCCETIKQATAEWAKDRPLTRITLYKQLREKLQGSVEGHNGSEYRRYPIDGGRLVFGGTAIDTGDFLEYLLAGFPIAKICAARPPSPLERSAASHNNQLANPPGGPTSLPPGRLPPARPNNQNNPLSDSHDQRTPPPKRPMKVCPYCGFAVRVERFDKHVAFKCQNRP